MGKAGTGQNTGLAWRGAAPYLALLVLGCFEFLVYPGHTYLASASQRYVAVLQRLNTPGYLSRDLVATHPNVTYTVYDELTLFLSDGLRVSIASALIGQQLVLRLAGLLGIFLLARTAGLSKWQAAGAAAAVNLALFVPGLDPGLAVLEPTPRTFAFGACLLAMGFLSRDKPLLAGLFGGLALLYDVTTAAVFWGAVAVAFLADRRMRTLLRPTFPVLLVFALLLANLAQLQPGTPDAWPLFSRLPPAAAALEQYRSPELWVTRWERGPVYGYLAVWVLGIWATARIWPALKRPARWLFGAAPAVCILSLPVSALLLDALQWQAMPKLQPLLSLRFTVMLSLLACLLAACRSAAEHKRVQAAAWLCVCAAVTGCVLRRPSPELDRSEMQRLARWAEAETWGGSMFLFADAGRAAYPGVFRAESWRPLWVDWESGAQVNDSPSMATEWAARWRQASGAGLSGPQLQSLLDLPIDYYVLRAGRLLVSTSAGRSEAVRWVYRDPRYTIYDANNLRSVRGELKLLVFRPGENTLRR